ncbi:hypothetical protein CLAFUW4_08647 [Fulvia fulva]|uniref:Uncharacterized protein n=1 Tax=Passalora fulva TaxID=5499 RepID=A0A9Q8LDU2_PASFU|nr:uncharacterized protein CLAFUR5_08746 [Fulvia fulva]KAK4629046.1 hypothetical protein CLAFUR4_08649 [Fulvia fulva]KAK4630231.1 hypothetical protein CLAFUR0_08645 [Fulvia fulva]UJO15567.1 hypothetical protein CLAFUR5_08746 [Fulvia fulva]WPV12043.1 hypothetical protein CLAFUW4_08647 [Fulvia fulva]WPV26982.1 hypothetical protein CLAFUW7_08644 [Fulvia fulva]
MALGTAPLIFAWLSDLIPQDPEARSLIVGVSVAGYYAISAWSQVLVWPASQAPYSKYGWQSCIAIWVLCIGMTCVLRYVDVRYLLPKRLDAGEVVVAGHAVVDGDVVPADELDGKKSAEVVAEWADGDRKETRELFDRMNV